MSNDYSTLTFRPDANGKAVCMDNTLALPALENYLRLEGNKSYPADVGNDGTIRIRLR